MSLNLDPRKTALVLIDLQKGILGRPLDPYPASQVIENSVLLCRQFAELRAPMVLVHVAFSPDGADRLSQPVDAPMQSPPGGFPADFAEFVPEIAAFTPNILITKRQWGAFYGTELDSQLRRRGINTIVLCGVATNFGVESTARQAWEANYSVVIAEDACTSGAPGLHQFAIEKILPRLSRVRSTNEILASLSTL